ncbi:hypothetical protein CI610_02274 [invertebrate metagenome]|uniref:Uncharacterized protein n=1 Tax=invertebrate metagenome TaxID=1711999 RepID=A0A2H9T6D9_9ZZZZ
MLMATFFCFLLKPALKVFVLFNRLTAICRNPASNSAASPLLIRQLSSRMATSSFQCSLFSICQWDRVATAST